MDAWKNSLLERQERRKDTLKAIASTTADQLQNSPRYHDGLSYAEILLYKVCQQTDGKGHDIQNSAERAAPQTHALNPAPQNITIQHTTPQACKDLNSLKKDDKQRLDGSWTLVSRKRVPKIMQQKATKVHPELTKHKQLLMAEKRCFKCLSKGHQISECRNVRRCLKCKAYGHIAGRCKAIKSSGKPSINMVQVKNREKWENSEEQNQHNHLEGKFFCQQYKKMSQRNNDWESMELSPASLVEGRPGTMRVYLPPREHNASYGVLDYSAVVLAGPHQADPYLAQRISTALAGRYDMNPRDFRVTSPDKTIGDMLIEFPDIDLCREAVREGLLLLANGTEVQLIQWTPALGMVQNAMPYRARVKLYDVPIYNRNKREINHLISGIGYVEELASITSNGRYEALRVLIACHDPRNIPQDLLMTTNPYARLVRVQLEGFIYIEPEPMTPFQPENNPPPPALRRPRDNEERNRPQIENQRNMEYPRQRRGVFHGTDHQHRDGFGQNRNLGKILETPINSNGGLVAKVTTPQVTKPNGEGGTVVKDKSREGGHKLNGEDEFTQGPLAQTQIEIQNGQGMQAGNLLADNRKGLAEMAISGDKMQNLRILGITLLTNKYGGEQSFNADLNCSYGNSTPFSVKLTFTPCIQTLQNPNSFAYLRKEMEHMRIDQVHGPFLLGSNKTKVASKAVTQHRPAAGLFNQKSRVQLDQDTSLTDLYLAASAQYKEIIFDITNMGLEFAPAAIKQTKKAEMITASVEINIEEENATGGIMLTGGSEGEQSDPSNDGPPPGFEGPPRYRRKARRSPRLQKKNSGKYISVVDRARATRGFINVSDLMQRVKTKPKMVTKPAMEYLKSYDPLTQGHAEAVVATAGVELTTELTNKIGELMAGPERDEPGQSTN